MKDHHHHLHHQAQMTIPHLFMCPISLDLFTDPVTLCTGQTYDRPSIEKWLAAGNLTCPVTMQKLHDLSVVPNHTLRHLIDQWSLIIAQQIDPELDYLASLKLNLESHQASPQNKLHSLERLESLIESRSSSLIQLGFVPSLLNLVLERDQDNVKLIEQALLCFLKLLPLSEKGCLNMLQERSKLDSILVLFRHNNVTSTSTISTSLCSLVETISSSPETKQLCAMLVQTRGLVHELVLLLLHQDAETSNAGIRAISALSSSSETNREILIREGAINALVTYISNTEKKEKSLAPMAVSTLEKLLAMEGAKEELIRNPDGVYALVKMVFTVSDHEGSESAVSSLTMVCCGSLEAREEAINGGVLTQLLLLLQSQCNGRTKAKARMLLKLLKSKWAEDTKSVCRYK